MYKITIEHTIDVQEKVSEPYQVVGEAPNEQGVMERQWGAPPDRTKWVKKSKTIYMQELDGIDFVAVIAAFNQVYFSTKPIKGGD